MKDQTIEAVKELIEKYVAIREKKGKGLDHLLFYQVGKTSTCPLCILHKNHNCKGCPQASQRGNPGCVGEGSSLLELLSLTYVEAIYKHERSRKEKLIKNLLSKRIKYLQNMLKSIRTWPEERFTPEGWTPYPFQEWEVEDE